MSVLLMPFNSCFFSSILVTALIVTSLLLCPTEGFVIWPLPSSSSARPSKRLRRRQTVVLLRYRNETASSLDHKSSSSSSSTTYYQQQQQQQQSQHREELKQALAVAAIEDYDMDAFYQQNNAHTETTAEDLMKELEQVNPWPKPAHHPLLNARWSFVFTGVPTIGMKLITLLSRISVGLSRKVLEFENVFLEVSDQQTQVKAIVRVQLMGQPVELNVFTKLRFPTADDTDFIITENDKGTLLIESFDKLLLMGVEVPTPASWKSSRQLEITYLDDDLMIARTAGGEPHLLLRHSPCSTDDDTCDLDDDEEPKTRFFQDAMAKYGKHLSRSLVDRAYSIMDDEENNNSEDGSTARSMDVANIVQLIRGIISSPSRSH